jgi:hypothetical protein
MDIKGYRTSSNCYYNSASTLHNYRMAAALVPRSAQIHGMDDGTDE